jgi:hypothetical protein
MFIRNRCCQSIWQHLMAFWLIHDTWWYNKV